LVQHQKAPARFAADGSIGAAHGDWNVSRGGRGSRRRLAAYLTAFAARLFPSHAGRQRVALCRMYDCW